MGMQRSGLVEIAREFLIAYRRTREVAALHRAGDLTFDVLQGWVGDDDASVLFRLKERCHGLIRNAPDDGEGLERASLLDLTVGALFHEAMRFRENFYQRDVYGPRVRRLQGGSEEEAGLIREFEKILSGASVRLDEALAETEALLEQTRRQFRGLLRANPEDGLVARLLIENAGYVALAFDGGLEALLAEVYGDAAAGYALAARSYLDSGHFADAVRCFAGAGERGDGGAGERGDGGAGERADWSRLSDYAAAMDAYLQGSYDDSMEALGRWLDGQPRPDEQGYAALALDAVSHLGRLVRPEDQPGIAPRADALTARLQSLLGAA